MLTSTPSILEDDIIEMLYVVSNYPVVNITGDRSSPLLADYETLDSIVVVRAEKDYAYKQSSQ